MEEWLGGIPQALTKVGIECCEEYAAAPARMISGPTAAVGLCNFDWKTGQAAVSVRILSPRRSGGRACQQAAFQAICALEEAAIPTSAEKMRYERGCDCFQMELNSTVQVRQPPAVPEPAWTVTVNGLKLAGVTEFSAVQDGQRRFVGAIGQKLPPAVLPPSAGWVLRVTVRPETEETAFTAEPSEVIVQRGQRRTRYSGVCWSKIAQTCRADGVTMEYQGFAPEQVEERIGKREIQNL